MRFKLIAMFLVLLIAPSLVLAANTASGPYKGDVYLKISKDVGGDSLTYKLTTSSTEGAAASPQNNPWELEAGGNITFRLLTATAGTVPTCNNVGPDNPCVYSIVMYYDNATSDNNIIRVISNSTSAFANNTLINVYATSDGTSTGAPRAGVFRLRMRAKSVADTEVTDYDASSDVGITDTTQQLTYDAAFAKGFARARFNVTNFTAYKDSAYATNDTRFMRGETVYLEFKTDASAWNTTGVETVVLTIEGTGSTLASFASNATYANNTYRATWAMPVDADLNQYRTTLSITGTSKAFVGTYTDQFSGQTEDLVLNNGSTVTLSGTLTYREIVISNGKIAVDGSLTLRADKGIIVQAGTFINATGRGDSGGVGGVGSEDCALGNHADDGVGDGKGTAGVSTPSAQGGAAGGAGGHGGAGSGGISVPATAGTGGGTHGSQTDRTSKKGSGGGGGDYGCSVESPGVGTSVVSGGNGGGGGGIVVLEADDNITISGTVEANGGAGQAGNVRLVSPTPAAGGGGGGGAGGTIILNSSKIIINSGGIVTATGGDGGQGKRFQNSPGNPDIITDCSGSGGGGGGGRIKIFAVELTNGGSVLVTQGFMLNTECGFNSADGVTGTKYTEAGEQWTNFSAKSFGRSTDTLSDFSVNNMTDPDAFATTANASFWVEEELRVTHDYGPRLNFSNSSAINAYVQRGENLNYSFVVLDEWNRTFASREINVSVNATAFERNFSTATTSAAARVTSNITVGTDWLDSYTNTTPGALENRNYTFRVRYPSNVTSDAQGSVGFNTSQDYMFDVDDELYVDTHVQNTTTLSKDPLDDGTEQSSYGVAKETAYVWVHVWNVRSEEQNDKNVTTWVYHNSKSRSDPTSTFTGTTGSDGWTAQLGSVAAQVPTGVWYFDSDVGADAYNNSGTDNEGVSFFSVPPVNVTFRLNFSVGAINNGNLANRWSCVQDTGNRTFVAFVFAGGEPLATGQYNTTPTGWNVNITQKVAESTYLAYANGTCTNVQNNEEDISKGLFKNRNFPAFATGDIARYTVKLALEYANVRFNNNLTWAEGSHRIILTNNKTTSTTVNITSSRQ
ncbi:MAG: hypothetical protein HYS81_02725 [Candidatus Aenigmatarchaeota archaeon]|nr:MAG: hypothetical protein HYS81_02725 [Candidatus Aenigmarchaeota archaeon]